MLSVPASRGNTVSLRHAGRCIYSSRGFSLGQSRGQRGGPVPQAKLSLRSCTVVFLAKRFQTATPSSLSGRSQLELVAWIWSSAELCVPANKLCSSQMHANIFLCGDCLIMSGQFPSPTSLHSILEPFNLLGDIYAAGTWHHQKKRKAGPLGGYCFGNECGCVVFC